MELRGGGDLGGTPRELQPEPDLATLPPAADGTDVFVGGRVDLTPTGEALLLAALPPVHHVRASLPEAAALRATLDRLLEELTGGRIGSAFAIRQHGQLLMLEMLRAFVGAADLPPGWLRLLADDQLRPALRLMHGEPGRPWTLPELAAAAAMSRTSFAERFRAVAGTPPLTYLSRWRMMLAQRALRDGEARIGPLAARLGYGSESAFSTAFRREVGVSPLQYRRGAREVRGVVPVGV